MVLFYILIPNKSIDLSPTFLYIFIFIKNLDIVTANCYNVLKMIDKKIYILGGILEMNLIGHWTTAPVTDGATSDEQLIILPDGTGVFAESNWMLLHVTDIMWNIENNILTIDYKDKTFKLIKGNVEFTQAIPVTDICGDTHNFDCFKIDSWTFYKLPSTGETVDEIMDELRYKIAQMRQMLKIF